MPYIPRPSLFSKRVEGSVTDDPFIDSTSAPDGTTNRYTNYCSQIAAVMDMKYGAGDFGSYTLNTVLNFLSAFILGENAIPYYTGSDENERKDFNEWVKNFLSFNNTHLGTFRDTIGEAVAYGRAVVALRPETKRNGDKGVKVWLITQEGAPYDIKTEDGSSTIPRYFWSPEISQWQIEPTNKGTNEDTVKLLSNKDNLLILNLSMVEDVNQPSYKPHFVLTEIENMDRALKNIRALNEKGARITPVWEVTTDAEYNKLTAILKKITWKIGQAIVGTGKFRYEVADTQKAIKGVMTEFELNGQAVASTCNIPVHYIALTELMSNRSTAETLYDVILHGTACERERLKDFLKDMYIQAQQIYIDKVKGSENSKVITDFTVPIEVIDKSRFKEMVEAYSILKADGVIGIPGYRKIVPNVDPQEEEEALKKEGEYRRVVADEEIETNTGGLEDGEGQIDS